MPNFDESWSWKFINVWLPVILSFFSLIISVCFDLLYPGANNDWTSKSGGVLISAGAFIGFKVVIQKWVNGDLFVRDESDESEKGPFVRKKFSQYAITLVIIGTLISSYGNVVLDCLGISD